MTAHVDRTGQVWEDVEEQLDEDVFLVVGPPHLPAPKAQPSIAYHPCVSLLDGRRYNRIERRDRHGPHGWDSFGALEDGLRRVA